MNERDLFIAALPIEDPAERCAYLDRICGDDAELRKRVEALLTAFGQAGSFLQQAAAPAATSDAIPARPAPARTSVEGTGAVIGPYKLLQQIGEGGMGTVFMAQQTQPVQRNVALKFIKAGMDSSQVIARFEAERQALALMDHPNIAKVLDAGATASGRPYFVMELVKGVPITRYCDEHHLTPRQRLELFVPVCQAVQHAHQKGIIHRDLKPSNVMVCLYDGKPVPKVIDFGVAKAAGPRLTEKTLFTELGQVVGTLEYMSPEQAELNQLDIDTRSDIYSLGVLLYELLTGTTPLDRKRFKAVAFLEVLRLIREEESPRPSTRLSTTDELPSIAANRGLEPKKLSGLMRGELDWIVMKTLEKDRNRRYESANGLAQDIERYLHDETVQACPPSMRYRLGKFARRHKTALGTTAAVLLTALAFGWILWDRAEQAETQRVERKERLIETQRAVGVALGRVEESVEQAKKMPTGKSEEAAAALVVWRQAEDALGQAAAALNTGTADDNMRQRVAAARKAVETGRLQTERGLATARRTEKLLRDLDEARVAWSTVNEGRFDFAAAAMKYGAAFAAFDLDIASGRTEELVRQISAAEPEVRAALVVALAEWANHAAASKTRWAPAKLRALAKAADNDAWRMRYHAAVAGADLKAMRALAAEARTLSLPASSLDLLATDLHVRGMRDEAIALLRSARSRCPTDFLLHFRLGSRLHTRTGRTPLELEEAIGCYRAALALRPGASVVHNNLGNVLRDKKELDEAMTEFQKAIELGPNYAQPRNGLGMVLYDKKQFAAAMAHFTKAIEVDPNFARAHNNLGTFWYGKKQWDKAMAEYQKAIDLDPTDGMPRNGLGNVLNRKRQFAAAIVEYQKAIDLDPIDATPHNGLGNALHDLKKFDAAIAAFQKAIDLEPTYSQPHNGLAIVLRDLKKLDEAIAEYRKAIELDPADAIPRFNLGVALYDQKHLDEAMAQHRKAIELDPEYLAPLNGLGTVLGDKNRLDEAIGVFQKAIEIDPKDPAPRYNLGTILRRQGRFAEALQAMQKSLALAAQQPVWSARLGLWIKRLELLVELKDKELREPVSLEAARKGISGQLAKDDFLDCFPKTRRCFRKSYPIQLKGGRHYQIDLTGEFDVFLHVEDHNLLTLAFNDDVLPPKELNSRLVFTPERDGIYRLVVTSANPGETGLYTLAVNEVTKAELVQTLKGELKKTEMANQGRFFKVHKIDLVAGRPYVFELDSPRFDSYLLLLDPSGQQKLTDNDDAGEFNSASRIDFTPKEAGTYQLLVTSYDAGGTGPFVLRIQGYEPPAAQARK